MPTQDEPWTWAKFRAVSKQLTRTATTASAWASSRRPRDALDRAQLRRQVLLPERLEDQFKFGAAEQKVPNLIHDMIWADKSVDPSSVSASGSAVLPGFFAGKYAMTMQGSYAAQQMVEQAPAGFHWIMLPPLKGATQDQAADPQTLSIAQQSKHKAEAMQFISYFLNAKNVAKLASGDWLIPSTGGRQGRARDEQEPGCLACQIALAEGARRRAVPEPQRVPAVEGQVRHARVPAVPAEPDQPRRPEQEADRRAGTRLPPDNGNGSHTGGGGVSARATEARPRSTRLARAAASSARPWAMPSAAPPRAGRRRTIVEHYGGQVTGVVPSMTYALGDRPLAPFHKGDGHVTDDTLMTHALVRVYEQKRDHLDAYDIERLLVPELIGQQIWIPELGREELLLQRLFLAEKWLVLRLHYGHVDPREAGVGNIVNCGAAMYARRSASPTRAAPMAPTARRSTSPGAHQSSYGREAAGVFAAAVAEALRPGADAGSVVECCLGSGRGRHARRDRGGVRGRARASTAGARAGWPRCARRSSPSTPSEPSTRSPGSAPAARAGCTASRSCRSRSAARGHRRRSSARRCSAASTTAATPTRSPRWAARSRARWRPRGIRADWVEQVSTASRIDLEAPGSEMAEVAARDLRPHERRTRRVASRTLGERECD